MSDADLVKLGKMLSDPTFMKAFAKDHIAALKGAGVNSAGIPGDVLKTLASLSEEELKALSRVKGALKGAGVSPEFCCEMV